MSSANKFADTGFLIDLYLSGKEKALEALRDKLSGKIVITNETIEELRRFAKADIKGLTEKWGQFTNLKADGPSSLVSGYAGLLAEAATKRSRDRGWDDLPAGQILLARFRQTGLGQALPLRDPTWLAPCAAVGSRSAGSTQPTFCYILRLVLASYAGKLIPLAPNAGILCVIPLELRLYWCAFRCPRRVGDTPPA